MNIKGKKFIVTGGAGFLGSHLVDKIIEKRGRVIIIDNLSTGKKENINRKAKLYKIDILSEKIGEIFSKERPDFVFHFAAQINLRESIINSIKDARINILGSINIFENCKRYKVKKIIFSSTGGAIYGDKGAIPSKESNKEMPISPYGISKLSTEKYLFYYGEVFKIPFVILRFSNIYGPRQNPMGEAGVVSIFSDLMVKNKQPFVIGKGNQTRDFVYVKDAVNASLLSLKKDISGIFNIATNKETDINKVFDSLKEIIGFKGIKKYLKEIEGEQRRSCLDNSKAKNILKWKPLYSFEDGLRETSLWFKKNN